MRCNSRLVGDGDPASLLLALCGQPALRDQFANVDSQAGRFIGEVEVWTYDFGSSHLLRLVKLRNGVITDIDSDGYGFVAGKASHCSPRELVDGVSKYRLLKKCGLPLSQRMEVGSRTLSDRPEIYRYTQDPYPYRNKYVSPSYREEWVYNFGARYSMRRVTIEDGWVTNVESIAQGFDPR